MIAELMLIYLLWWINWNNEDDVPDPVIEGRELIGGKWEILEEKSIEWEDGILGITDDYPVLSKEEEDLLIKLKNKAGYEAE